MFCGFTNFVLLFLWRFSFCFVSLFLQDFRGWFYVFAYRFYWGIYSPLFLLLSIKLLVVLFGFILAPDVYFGVVIFFGFWFPVEGCSMINTSLSSCFPDSIVTTVYSFG